MKYLLSKNKYILSLSMRTITVTSINSWNHDVKIEFEIGNDVKTLFYYKNRAINYFNDVDSFIAKFQTLFMMFGVIEDLKVQDGTIQEVYDIVYDMKLPENIVFIISNNLNFGDKKTGESVDTFDDLVKLIGSWKKTTQYTNRDYYEYPVGLVINFEVLYKNGMNMNPHFMEEIVGDEICPSYNYVYIYSTI